MFLKDEYIVCLNTPEDDKDFPPNFVFKQRDNETYLSVEKDAKGDKNSWANILFDKSRIYSEWRYSTEEEANEYERLGKPYDITTLNKFVLPSKWCIKLTDKNKKVLGKWRTAGLETTEPGYLTYDPDSTHIGIWEPTKPKDLPEITYSQFLKYVLGEEVIEVKDDLTSLKNLLEKIGIT
jgi:hypothetical protein